MIRRGGLSADGHVSMREFKGRCAGMVTEQQHPPRIVLAVTAPISLKLMTGFPEYLAAEGWDVHVVTSDQTQCRYPRGVTLHNVAMVREPSPWRDVRALVGWLWLLARLRPDIVVAGTPKAGLLGMAAAWCVRIPARVYLVRGLRLETEQGVRRRILHVLEGLSARFATVVQCVSRSLRDEFISLGLAPASKVVVLGAGSSNGVEVFHEGDLEPVSRARLGLDDDVPVVGYVGRMTRDKGLATLTESVRILHDSRTAIQVLLVGPEEPRGALDRALKSAGLPASSVHWVGSVPDARPYLGAMDVLCLPTRREGFPNVVLEAAVQGVPAVVSDVTGARDAVIDGRTGLICAPDDSRDMAVALNRLLGDPAGLQAMGQRAKEHAVKNYDREVVWELNRAFFEAHVPTRGEKVKQ